ncbi:MAG TPA: HAD family phosphatase [Candidatus Saccharimonadales bacterium]
MSQQSLADYIEAHNKTHLIFDFDGTLAYMDIPWSERGEAFRDELRELDEELWLKYDKRGGTLFSNDLVRKHGKKGLDILLKHAPLFEMQHKERFIRNEELLRDVENFKDTYRMYIWSSNSRQLVEWVLEANGMQDWFDKIVTRNDVRYLKPNPEGFLHIYDPDVPEERYLLIGDSSYDEGAAQAAGIDFYHTDFFNLGR